MAVREVCPEYRENPQVRQLGGLGTGKGSQASETDGVRPCRLRQPPAAQRWPEVPARKRVRGEGLPASGASRLAWEVFSTCVSRPVSPRFLRSGAAAGVGGEGAHLLRLILCLGALAAEGFQYPNRGHTGEPRGEESGSHRGRLGPVKPGAFQPHLGFCWPQPWACARRVRAAGEVAPTFLAAWGSGSPFPAPPKG